MIEFVVEGMKCGGCAAGVTRAVKSVDSSAEVKIDLAAKTVQVNSMSQVSIIRQAIVNAGYRASGGGMQGASGDF